MKYLLERKDLEKREEILKFLDEIVLVVKKHFIKIIDNLLTGKNTIGDYIHNAHLYKNHNPEREDIFIRDSTLIIKLNKKYRFKIILTNSSGGSYSKEKKLAKNFYFFLLVMTFMID